MVSALPFLFRHLKKAGADSWIISGILRFAVALLTGTS